MSFPVKNIKRVLKDYAALVEEGPESGIFVKTINDDVSKIYMMIIGPVGSPYEGCPMFFTIEPGTQYTSGLQGSVNAGLQYPVAPPRVLFHSPYSIRCHPNLYQPSAMIGGDGGKVCLSILGTWAGEPWVAFMTFMTIAQTILGILDDHPLCNEPGYYGKKNHPAVAEYTDYIQYVCIKEATEKFLIPSVHEEQLNHPIAPHFKEEMCGWVLQHQGRYVERLLGLNEKFDGKSVAKSSQYGNKSWYGSVYDYGILAKKFSEL